jgi:hypothetical protein
MMATNRRCRTLFRDADGFQAVVRLLRELAAAVEDEPATVAAVSGRVHALGADDAQRWGAPADMHDHAQQFVLAALRALAEGLKDDADNRRHFAGVVKLGTLIPALASPFLVSPAYGLDICEVGDGCGRGPL